MTRPNEQNQPTFLSWETGKIIALYGIGIAAGIFIYKTGLLQKVTGKLFSKDKGNSQEESY